MQRNFLIGDKWIYYKIYTGVKTSDQILTEIIHPITQDLINSNKISEWFFIRYTDPNYHLRVRFYCEETDNINFVISKFHPYFKEYLDFEMISKIQIDTYQREIERYGKLTMNISEKLFFYDSIMCLNSLLLFKNVINDKNIRWLFSLKAIDSLLDCFNLNLMEKKSFIESISISFRKEFDESKFLGKQINQKYRIHAKEIKKFMNYEEPFQVLRNQIKTIIDEKTNNTKDLIQEILRLNEENKLNVNINNLLASHVHMMMNRLFRSKNRLNEMICYDFLTRYYKSLIARGK